jgi:hypothetical protein
VPPMRWVRLTARPSTFKRSFGAGSDKSRLSTVPDSYVLRWSVWRSRLCAAVRSRLSSLPSLSPPICMRVGRTNNSPVLPISQIPSLAACITTAAHLMPLEDIFRVPLPPQSPIDEHAHKKTYRDGMARPQVDVGPRWTAGAIMEGRALDRGYCECHRRMNVRVWVGWVLIDSDGERRAA